MLWCKFLATVAATVSLVSLPLTSIAEAPDQPNVMVVFDASGSMWGQIGGVTKIEIAQDAFSGAQSAWDRAGQKIGLVAYGHRRKGDCSDIETLVSLEDGTGARVAEQVQSLRPKGKTPLSSAIRMAADELRFREEAATVILFSDGIETCNADPCALAAELEQDGINFTAHVIGFGLSADTDRTQLECIANNSGGQFIEASDATGLQDALRKVAVNEPTDPEPEPVAMIPVRITVQVTEGTARPAMVTLRATDMATGEKQALGTLRDAAEVIQGLQAELPPGEWRIEAISEEGGGGITMNVSADTQQIDVPFSANDTGFVMATDGPYRLGVEHMFFLGVTDPLQANAEYTVALFPAGATEYDQRIDWETRFGSDSTGFTEHGLASPQMPGDYEVIVLQGYDLSEAKARFPITYEEGAPIRWMGKTQGEPGERLPIRISGDAYRNNNLALRASDGSEIIGQWLQAYVTPGNGPMLTLPKTAGVYELFYNATSEEGEISLGKITVGDVVQADDPDAVAPPDDQSPQTGTVYAKLVDKTGYFMDLPALWTLRREDGTELASRQEFTGSVRFENIPSGTYELIVYREEDWGGTTEAIATVLVRAGETTTVKPVVVVYGDDIGEDGPAPEGDVSEPVVGEDPNTMISEEELAAETGPRDDIAFNIDETCDGPDPCRIQDPRIGLDIMLPPGWAISEGYYYTNAGGGTAENPTVEMARLSMGQFDVVLNPHQWDAMLGPCEEVLMGTLCRTESEVTRDLEDYAIIRDSFLGIIPPPPGYLDVRKTWTLEDSTFGGFVGTLTLTASDWRDDNFTGQLALTQAAATRLDMPGAITIDVDVRLDRLINGMIRKADIIGSMDQTTIYLDLHRPDDWDGNANIWNGDITTSDTFNGIFYDAF